jgi:hypothetical protein
VVLIISNPVGINAHPTKNSPYFPVT